MCQFRFGLGSTTDFAGGVYDALLDSLFGRIWIPLPHNVSPNLPKISQSQDEWNKYCVRLLLSCNALTTPYRTPHVNVSD